MMISQNFSTEPGSETTPPDDLIPSSEWMAYMLKVVGSNIAYGGQAHPESQLLNLALDHAAVEQAAGHIVSHAGPS